MIQGAGYMKIRSGKKHAYVSSTGSIIVAADRRKMILISGSFVNLANRPRTAGLTTQLQYACRLYELQLNPIRV
jgi:hypothetical protein